MNGRLDTIQAAVLIEKLKIFPDEIAARERVARRYTRRSADVATVPQVPTGFDLGVGAVHHPACRPGSATRSRRRCSAGHSDRDLLSEARAPADRLPRFPVADGGLPVTDRLADEVISLPMHAYLDEATQDRIIDGGAARACAPETQGILPALMRRGASHDDQPHLHRRRLDAAFARHRLCCATSCWRPCSAPGRWRTRSSSRCGCPIISARSSPKARSTRRSCRPMRACARRTAPMPAQTVRRPHLHAAAGEPDRAARDRAALHAGGDRPAGAGLRRRPGRFALAVELTRITFPYLLLISLVTLYRRHPQCARPVRGRGGGADPAQPLHDGRRWRSRHSFRPPGHAAAWGVLIAGVLEVLLVGGDALRAGVLPACAGRSSTTT